MPIVHISHGVALFRKRYGGERAGPHGLAQDRIGRTCSANGSETDDRRGSSSVFAFCPVPAPVAFARALLHSRRLAMATNTPDDQCWMHLARIIKQLQRTSRGSRLCGRQGSRASWWSGAKHSVDSTSRPEAGATAGDRSQGANITRRVQFTRWRTHGAGNPHQQDWLQTVEPSQQLRGTNQRQWAGKRGTNAPTVVPETTGVVDPQRLAQHV